MAIDFKHAERVFLYRDEQGGFRQMSFITKSVATYLLKLVDPVGGWLPLNGRTPWDAVRLTASGACGQGDRRIVKRAVLELLAEGYLEVGRMVDGELLPCDEHDADAVGVRNWVPAQNGYDREQTACWQAERQARAARYWSELQQSRELDRSARPGQDEDREWTEDVLSEDRLCTERELSEDRACTENSVTARNSNGTKLALIPYHTGPYHEPPISPLRRKGDGSLSRGSPQLALVPDERSSTGGERFGSEIAPVDHVQEFADRVVSHLNAQTGRRFDSAGKELRKKLCKLIKQGVTVEQACAVIDAKCAEWLRPGSVDKMAVQLKPSVLFRPGNFARYLEDDVGTGKPPTRTGRQIDPIMAERDRRRAAGEVL